MIVTRQGHIGTRQGVGGRHDVLAQARRLDAVGNGVAGHPERILKGQRRRAQRLPEISAVKLNQAGRRHP